MTQRHRINQQGSAIIFAIGFMVVTLVIALGVQTLVADQLQLSGQLRQRVTAGYLAQGGVARAIGWFKSKGYIIPQAADLTATVPVKRVSNDATVVLPSNHPDSYTDALALAESGVVSSFNTYLTSQTVNGGSYSVTATLMNALPETWELLATGQQGTTQRQVGAIITRPWGPLFQEALFGRDSVGINSAQTDGYDPSLGPYGGANVSATGSVRSNGNITLGGGAIVNGNANPGPNMTVTMNNSSTVTGDTTPSSAERQLWPVVIPGNAVPISDIKLSGGKGRTLTSGTYLVDTIDITGSGELDIDTSDGPVYLYVTNKVHVGGHGIVNLGGDPKMLGIFDTGTADSVFSGSSDFYGTVYAPESALSLSGGAQFYGAFVGAQLDVNSTKGAIHFDNQLRTVQYPGQFTLVSQWTVPS
jgi:hypothetical protein